MMKTFSQKRKYNGGLIWKDSVEGGIFGRMVKVSKLLYPLSNFPFFLFFPPCLLHIHDIYFTSLHHFHHLLTARPFNKLPPNHIKIFLISVELISGIFAQGYEDLQGKESRNLRYVSVASVPILSNRQMMTNFDTAIWANHSWKGCKAI